MTRTSTRLLAASGAVVLTALAASPAAAAAVTSRADANAATVSIAGNAQGTGTVEATYDGQETVTGETSPPASPISQDFLDLGVLTQQATAGNGTSAACAGVAGNGGGVIQVGDGSCLTPGDTVNGSLSDIGLDAFGIEPPEGLPAELPQELQDLLGGLVGGSDELDAIIDEAVGAVDDQLGPLGLALRFDAIEGRCRVDDGSPSGTASITNASLVLSGAGETIQVVQLPANPPPNTEVTTDLSVVADTLLGAVTTQFRDGLGGATGPLADLTEQAQTELVTAFRDNLDGQLAPLRDNLLSVVLNEQSRPTSDSIRVSALHARVVPAAAEAVGASLAEVQLGNVGCGPADRVAAEAAPPTPQGVPELPTAVSAGVEGTTTTLSARLAEAAPLTGVGVAGLLVLAAGLVGLRRRHG